MSTIATNEELREAAEEAATEAVREYLVGRGIMSAERFSIIHEEVCGARAGRKWVEQNREHPHFPFLLKAASRGRAFEGCAPEVLWKLLVLDDSEIEAWWSKWGSEQRPSNSWVRAFLEAVCIAA